MPHGLFYVYGVRRKGKKLPVDPYTHETVPGWIYETHWRVHSGQEKLRNMASVVEFIKRKLSEKPELIDADIVYAEYDSGTNTLIIQFKGSPFALSTLIAALPAILSLAGIIVTLVGVYSVVSAVPGWAWALLLVGLLLSGLLPTVIDMIRSAIGGAAGHEKSG